MTSWPRNLARSTAAHNLSAATHSAARAAADWLVENQKPDGHWVGRPETNACMEAEWILALWFMGLENHPLRERLGRSLLETQRADGAWQVYHGAPNGDVNATVEAYAALRSLGLPDDDPALAKARAWIASKGGLAHIRVFTRYWLALIGEWPWHKTPNIPAEIVWFPLWTPFSIYHFAQWARATLDGDRRAVSEAPRAPAAARAASRRALSARPRQIRLQPAAQGRRGRLGHSSSAAPMSSCTRCRRWAASSRSVSFATRRFGMCSNGSSVIRTPTAAGAASSRRGSTA